MTPTTTTIPESGAKAFRLMGLLNPSNPEQRSPSVPPGTPHITQPNRLSAAWAGIAITAAEVGFFGGNPEFDLVRACRDAITGAKRQLSPGTLRDYAKKAKRQKALRPDPDSPPDLDSHYPKPSSVVLHSY
jgi:hypothetical protein